VKVQVPMMVDDGRFAPQGRGGATEVVQIEEDFFLDGPVSQRVAVLDFDPQTGSLEPGVPYIPPTKGKKLGHYDLPVPLDISSPAFGRVSVFATVCKTIQMFEKDDVLGRPVRWAFGPSQLLVVPRAGRDENAFYERHSHSLQFFFFPSPYEGNELIYTSLARDIVAHVTGQAILDGVAPHLWFAVAPQSRALYEAIGDLTALLVSIDSRTLREAVLKGTDGSIEDSTHFSAVAEQFGMAKGTGALRSLYDEGLVLSDAIRGEEHDLARVLTAALYSFLVKIYEFRKAERIATTGDDGDDLGLWNRFLVLAATQFRRMTMRALDYLPPGEISFADYGRAIIAADWAAHPDDHKERYWLCDEFVRRRMAASSSALLVEPPPEDGLEGIDLQGLLDSDGEAYDFANSRQGRQLLGIPAGAQVYVEPRLRVERDYFHRQQDGAPAVQKVGECLFKVWWYRQEQNRLGPGFPTRRDVAVGTTMAWDRDTGKLRTLLTTGNRNRDELAKQQQDRDHLLARLADEGILRSGSQRLGPDGRPLRRQASFETRGRVMRVSSIPRTLRWERER
jgi:hypothetical protein